MQICAQLIAHPYMSWTAPIESPLAVFDWSNTLSVSAIPLTTASCTRKAVRAIINTLTPAKAVHWERVRGKSSTRIIDNSPAFERNDTFPQELEAKNFENVDPAFRIMELST